MTHELNGIRITGPDKVKRNSFVSVRAEVLTDEYERPHDAWAAACGVASGLYGSYPVEDNTVGQVAQVDGVDGSKAGLPSKGRVFSFGLNLYGIKVTDLNKRLSLYR